MSPHLYVTRIQLKGTKKLPEIVGRTGSWRTASHGAQGLANELANKGYSVVVKNTETGLETPFVSELNSPVPDAAPDLSANLQNL